MNILVYFFIVGSVLALATAQLRLKSNGVDYTNDTFYAPFGTSFTISCQGESGAKKWEIVITSSTAFDVSTDETDTLFQRPDGQNQELVITDFQENIQLTYQCRDPSGITPAVIVRVEEGVVITSYSVGTTSVQLLWEPSSDNTVVSGTCCLDKTRPSSCETSSSTATLNSGSVTISDLEEFTEYVCYINDRSRDVPVMTSSAEPSGPPLDVNLTVQGMTSLELSWSLPNETDRNGIITGYYVECLGEGIPRGPTETGTTTMTFSNLPHHTMYACRVAAVNVNGTGPYSMYKNITTPQGAPGPVDITVRKFDNDDSRVSVSWSPPVPLNGVLTKYTVKYREYDSQDDNTTDTNESTREIEISGLVPGVPYSVVVIAETEGGTGEESEWTLFFSKELMPTEAVSGVNVVRLSANEMMVSWTSLTPREARGFPVYTVTYTPTGPSGRVSRQAQSKQTQQNSTTISDLMEDATYSVIVGASTAGGSGPDSNPENVPPFITPTTVDLSSTEPPPAVGIVIAVVIIVSFVVVVAVVLVAIVVCYKYKKRKKTVNFYNEELCESGSDSQGTLSKSTSRDPPELETVVSLPPKGEKPDGHVCDPSSGQLTARATPDEDDILAAEIDQIKPPDIKNERQYVNLLPPVKRSQFFDYMKEMRINDSFAVEYKGLPLRDFTAQTSAGQACPEKNRYRKIIPYDHSRVSISGKCDYINASFITGYDKKISYVVAQGPLPHTTSDFWQMVMENKMSVIVMLTKVEEKGKMKCVQYWNDKVSEPFTLENGLAVTLLEHKSFAEYEVRTFSLTKEGDDSFSMYIKHFQYTAWPDHGVPKYPASVIKFIQVIRDHHSDKSPLLVHCSAGVGRSGTMIAIDAMMQRLEKKNDINIYEFMYSMRCDRPYMIQNLEQYIFVHEAISEYVTCGDTSVKAHDFESTLVSLRQIRNTNMTGFEEQFKLLKQLSRFPLKGDEEFAEQNVHENRYAARFPYQANCFYVPGNRASRYVNASQIDTYSVSKGVIATQLPLPSTVQDLLKVILFKRCQTVVAICTLEELKDTSVCCFWSSDDGDPVFDQFSIKILGKRDIAECSVYKLQLSMEDEQGKESREFTLIHFYGWPEVGEVQPSTILNVIQEYDQAQKGSTASAVVMCNDGMGRTGAFICMCSEIERIKMEASADIFQSVKAARNQRPYMVSTVEQYILIHDLVGCYLQVFQPYANFKKLDLV